MSNQQTVWQEVILAAGITLGVTSTVIGPAIAARCKNLTFYIEFAGGSSAGKVQIETAASADYSHTWAPLGSEVSWAADNTCAIVTAVGCYAAVRARITTAIAGGGTVTVTFIGN